MSRQQDKATNDRHARILRDLVKQPDNKACADCKKNDARWASWNLGVYLCIRCSGIHRSMGTHISKVKSIDLDMWTPEQMESIQKWGNKRANLYWERHLKAGHIPPDHKIESFIRSKYESKRWAMDGPPPSDPSILESGAASSPAPVAAPKPTPTSSAPAPTPAARTAHPLLSRQTAKPAPSIAPIVDLMGGDDAPAPTPTAAPTQTSAPAPAAAQTAAKAPGPTAAPANNANIFDLDFRAPTPSASKPQTAKADIMSLFATASPPAAQPAPTQSFFSSPAPAPAQNNYASWQGGVTSSAPPVQQAPTQSFVPTQSTQTSGWGLQVDQNAWGAPVQPASTQVQQPTASAAWGSDPWSTPATSNSNGLGTAKKDDLDPFANIWK